MRSFSTVVSVIAITRTLDVAFLMAVGSQSSQAESGKFVLVRDGQPAVTIITAAAASEPATFGAQELQLHVQKITGAKLPIKTDGATVGGPRILVGASAAAAQLGLEEGQFKDQEYLIRFLPDNTLVLLGKEEGTSYAVHDFLERFCDVRWYGPGDSQMTLPKTATLAVQPREIRRWPTFAWRVVLPELEILATARELYGNPSSQDMSLFGRRLRAGGEAYALNHSLYGYYDRFWMKNPQCPAAFVAPHPDWFAHGYSAAEQEPYGKRPPQMCFSQQGVVDQVVADARKFFDGQAPVGLRSELLATVGGKYFALVPMDAHWAVWCRCPACEAQLDQERKAFDGSNGFASDYWFTFVNKVAREVAKTHPGRYIATAAYAGYSAHPRKERLEPNVSVQMSLHTRNWWAPKMKEHELGWYRDWVSGEKGRPLYLWLYYLYPEYNGGMGGFPCFPGFFAHAVGEQIRMFARDGVRGAFIEGAGDQVDTYVTLKLLDDPSLDVDVLLDEFFTRYYGPAAAPLKRLYLRIEDIYFKPAYYPEEVRANGNKEFFQTEEIAWKYLGTEARMAELGAFMDEATRLAVGDVEKHRVALFRKTIWDRMVEGRKQYMAKQLNKPSR